MRDIFDIYLEYLQKEYSYFGNSLDKENLDYVNYIKNRLPLEKNRFKRYAQRIEWGWIIDWLEGKNKKCKILDVGCGRGVDSMLFALAGHSVAGIDIYKDWLNIGNKRKEFYVEQLGIKLDLSFYNQNIFSYIKSQSQHYDLIFCRQAISHVHPAEEFLKLAYQYLNSKGILIISDSNKLNLINQVLAFKSRGTQIYTKMLDPASGEYIPFALERLFSIAEMTKKLRDCRFNIIYREGYWGLNKKSNEFFYNKLIRKINQNLLLSSLLCHTYFIVGVKNDII